MRTLGHLTLAIFAIGIGLYPSIYFMGDRTFGLLSTKSAELLDNFWWNAGFYLHIVPGGIAMLTGWTQFIKRWRDRHLSLHRRLGLVYVIAAWTAGSAGFSIAFVASGGWIAATGFVCLGVVWITTTLAAFLAIKEKQIDKHQKWMIYSYAACFAAVMLRLWLPLLTTVFGDFFIAYRVVAWLCWVPNIFVAYLIVSRSVSGAGSRVPGSELG